MTVLSPEKAPHRVRAVKDELPMPTLVEAAEARLAEFAPDYELVEIVVPSTRIDAMWQAARGTRT